MSRILLTGANRGLGLATAKRLAAAGHELILTTRTEAKGAAALAEIREAAPRAKLEHHTLELASFAAVRACAEAVSRAHAGDIDVLLLNAGELFASPSPTRTADGLERTLQINAVSQLLLARLLLPALARPARIIALGSSLHQPDSRGAAVEFRFDDPQLEGPGRYHVDRAYKNSKLALLWIVFELERRLGPAGVHADAVCPGFIPTTAAEGPSARLNPLQRFALRHILPRMPFATALDDAAARLSALVGELAGRDEVGGRYYHRWAPAAPSADARDPEQAARFWRMACAWVGLPPELEQG